MFRGQAFCSRLYEFVRPLRRESPRWGVHRARYRRRRALRRHHGLPLRQLPGDVVLPRLGHQRVSYRNISFEQFTIQASLPVTCCLVVVSRQQSHSGSQFVCNITKTNEGGTISEEEPGQLLPRPYRRPFSRSGFASTANFAVRHDDKFDPSTQGEFYERRHFQ